MSTIWVECWKCDVCEFRWIKEELWPDRCKRKSCRSRQWNKLSAKSVGVVETKMVSVSPVVVSDPVHDVHVEPVADVSALSFADKKAVALAAIANAGKHQAAAKEPVPPAYSLEPCPYTEPDLESGNVYACSLHLGHKCKHARGAIVGDIW